VDLRISTKGKDEGIIGVKHFVTYNNGINFNIIDQI